jgi:hypothetical protein
MVAKKRSRNKSLLQTRTKAMARPATMPAGNKASARVAEKARAQAASTTFNQFPQLPPELRHKIWHFAALEASRPDRAYILQSKHVNPRKEKCPGHFLVGHGLLTTTTESRAIALKVLKDSYRNNKFFIPYSLFGSINKFAHKPERAPEWISEVEHIAVDMKMARELYWTASILPQFRALKSITVVFVADKGYLDHDDTLIKITPRCGGQLILREMTRGQTQRLRLPAQKIHPDMFPRELIYAGPILDCPTVDSITAKDFLDDTENGLQRFSAGKMASTPALQAACLDGRTKTGWDEWKSQNKTHFNPKHPAPWD